MGILKGKNALVTGTSQGIGAAIAKNLIEAGCNICMHCFRSSEEPERMKVNAIERGQNAACLQADLTNEVDVIRCINEAVKIFGSFDVLINNSGALVERRSISALDLAYWCKLIDINLTTMMLVTKELEPYLNKKDGSSIVNVSSLAGSKIFGFRIRRFYHRRDYRH
jgi:3-oxoacyl-[acyl-carrier protein] reductase